MDKLTAQYIEDHQNQIHTYESFGRAVADLLLQSAKEQLANGTLRDEDATFKADISVLPISAKGCIGVKVCVPLAGCTRIHVSA